MARQNASALSLATSLGASLGAAAMHTGMTLWCRWPILTAVATRSVRPQDAAELDRMVREKVAATSQGILEAQAEVFRIATQAVSGKLKLSDACHAPLAVARASLQPALHTVKANSRRLGKRRTWRGRRRS
jgi:hypothetical protein